MFFQALYSGVWRPFTLDYICCCCLPVITLIVILHNKKVNTAGLTSTWRP